MASREPFSFATRKCSGAASDPSSRMTVDASWSSRSTAKPSIEKPSAPKSAPLKSTTAVLASHTQRISFAIEISSASHVTAALKRSRSAARTIGAAATALPSSTRKASSAAASPFSSLAMSRCRLASSPAEVPGKSRSPTSSRSPRTSSQSKAADSCASVFAPERMRSTSRSFSRAAPPSAPADAASRERTFLGVRSHSYFAARSQSSRCLSMPSSAAGEAAPAVTAAS